MAETPLHTFGPIDIYKGTTSDFTAKLYNEDNTAFGLAASDVVRVKVWDYPSGNGSVPDLDLDSAAPSANSSSVTIETIGSDGVTPARVKVRFAQDDTALLSEQEYRVEISYVDDSETAPTDANKVIAVGTANVIGTATGDRGKA